MHPFCYLDAIFYFILVFHSCPNILKLNIEKWLFKDIALEDV